MVAADDPRLTHIERLVAAIHLPISRWDRDARLMFCSEHYIAWADRPREQLLGHALQDLFGEDTWAAAAPAFAQAFGGGTVGYRRRLAHGPAPGRWAAIQVFPDADAVGTVQAVFTIATDIHDDVIARETLTATQRRLDRFTENIPYPLTYVDRAFQLRFVNKAYCEATGAKSEDLIGRRIGEARGARPSTSRTSCARCKARRSSTRAS